MKRSSRLLLLLSTTALFNAPSLASQMANDDPYSDKPPSKSSVPNSSGAPTLQNDDVAVSTGQNTSLDPDDDKEAVSSNQNEKENKPLAYWDQYRANITRQDEEDFAATQPVDYSFHAEKQNLSKFPDNISQNKNITNVYLDHNELSGKSLEEAGPLLNLKVLSLRHNKLTPMFKLNAPNVEVLELSYNPNLYEIRLKDFPKLKRIYVDQKVILIAYNYKSYEWWNWEKKKYTDYSFSMKADDREIMVMRNPKQ